MRFLLLIAYDDSEWPESTAEQRQEFFDAHHAFEQSVYAHGQLVSGNALQQPPLHPSPSSGELSGALHSICRAHERRRAGRLVA